MKVRAQNEKAQKPDPGANHTSGNGSGFATASEPPSLEIERKSGGPRTKEGKERSKRNAHKHGIFSRVVLRDTEFGWEFKSLLRGLRDDFKPVGTLEGILVEKLASFIWRYRRMLSAKRAEIQRGTEYFCWDE